MKRAGIFFLCAIILLSFSGSVSRQGVLAESMQSTIPSNTSVNSAWGGMMCEANGFLYYVSASFGSNSRIVRLGPDGIPTPVTEEYAYIAELSSDGDYVYFVTMSDESDTVYRLPVNGANEQKVTEGNIADLQIANGKLYWMDASTTNGTKAWLDATTIQIKCICSDGSNDKTLISLSGTGLYGAPRVLLVTANDIYYSIGTTLCTSDIYRMDMDGKNNTKLNAGQLDTIDKLFYDQGELYFLMQHADGSTDFWDSLETIDKRGNLQTIVGKVGYFDQDLGCIQYCGISGGMVYYWLLPSYTGNAEHLFMDLHQYNTATRIDTVLLRNVEMGDPSVGRIFSLRGKHIDNDGVTGLYILGNDIYFSINRLP